MDLKSCKNKIIIYFFNSFDKDFLVSTSELIKFSFKIIYIYPYINPAVGSVIGIRNKPLKGFNSFECLTIKNYNCIN